MKGVDDLPICNICGADLPRSNKTLCPDCGRLLFKLRNTFIIPPGADTRRTANVYLRESRFAYCSRSSAAGLLSGGLCGDSFDASEVCAIDYPVDVKGFKALCTVALRLRDGRSMIVWAGSRRKAEAVYNTLSQTYLQK